MRKLLVVLATLPALGQTQSGEISGVVTSENGQPVADATVLYTRVVALRPGQFGHGTIEPAPGEVPLSSSVQSEASGRFQAGSLPPGDYIVCAEAYGTPFLNPCKWSASYSATLTAGGQATLSITMKRGVFLNVRVNDPNGLLPTAPASPLDFPHLIVAAIYGTGAFVAAETVKVDSAGRDFQMPIPAGAPLSLWLQSRQVTLADAQSRPVGNLIEGVRIPFQASAGQNQSFSFQVTGSVE